ncbi:MAG UNVERIFIED_CONTAM: hypothetical protein LVT10_17220 [Anaerolineae bacterium]
MGDSPGGMLGSGTALLVHIVDHAQPIEGEIGGNQREDVGAICRRLVPSLLWR